MTLIGHRLKQARWYRPQQIAPDVGQIGFMASPKGSLDQLEEGEQPADGQRVFQGQLDNKWFLNALSMVAVEPKAFNRVNCLDPGTFR